MCPRSSRGFVSAPGCGGGVQRRTGVAARLREQALHPGYVPRARVRVRLRVLAALCAAEGENSGAAIEPSHVRLHVPLNQHRTQAQKQPQAWQNGTAFGGDRPDDRQNMRGGTCGEPRRLICKLHDSLLRLLTTPMCPSQAPTPLPTEQARCTGARRPARGRTCVSSGAYSTMRAVVSPVALRKSSWQSYARHASSMACATLPASTVGATPPPRAAPSSKSSRHRPRRPRVCTAPRRGSIDANAPLTASLATPAAARMHVATCRSIFLRWQLCTTRAARRLGRSRRVNRYTGGPAQGGGAPSMACWPAVKSCGWPAGAARPAVCAPSMRPASASTAAM